MAIIPVEFEAVEELVIQDWSMTMIYVLPWPAPVVGNEALVEVGSGGEISYYWILFQDPVHTSSRWIRLMFVLCPVASEKRRVMDCERGWWWRSIHRVRPTCSPIPVIVVGLGTVEGWFREVSCTGETGRDTLVVVCREEVESGFWDEARRLLLGNIRLIHSLIHSIVDCLSSW
jgi:hypothetical protein